MQAPGRYLRLLLAFGRYSLAREVALRGNFLAKVIVEILWLSILLIFYRMIFAKTDLVAGWSENEYLFFVGCYFALEGIIETFFLENCNSFADLVRSGDLDFFLLKPIDEQFLVTCRKIDWSTSPNVLLGAAVMTLALHGMGWPFDLTRAAVFLVTFLCGIALAYGFMVTLTAASMWMLRSQSLFELWWLFTSLMRYPREIFAGRWASPMGWFFTFIVPVLLVVNVPSGVMVRVLEPWMCVFTVLVTVALLFVSRRFFRFALRRYRSASS